MDSLNLFMPAFSSLVTCCISAEVFRSLALFITYSLHKIKPSTNLKKKKSSRFEGRSRRPGFSQFPEPAGPYLSKPQIGIVVLRTYADLLCSSESSTNIKKFARAVTNKVSSEKLYI